MRRVFSADVDGERLTIARDRPIGDLNATGRDCQAPTALGFSTKPCEIDGAQFSLETLEWTFA